MYIDVFLYAFEYLTSRIDGSHPLSVYVKTPVTKFLKHFFGSLHVPKCKTLHETSEYIHTYIDILFACIGTWAFWNFGSDQFFVISGKFNTSQTRNCFRNSTWLTFYIFQNINAPTTVQSCYEN